MNMKTTLKLANLALSTTHNAQRTTHNAQRTNLTKTLALLVLYWVGFLTSFGQVLNNLKNIITIKYFIKLLLIFFLTNNVQGQWAGSNPISTSSNVNIQSAANDASLDVGGAGDSATVQITTPWIASGGYVGPFRIRGNNTTLLGPPTWGTITTYFPLFCVKTNGFVGLKTETPTELLTLNGGNALALNGSFISRNGSLITQNTSGTTNFRVDGNGLLIARQIDVHLDPIPDYVFHATFNKDSAELYSKIGKYKKLSLYEIDDFVKKYHHLPGIKSATQYSAIGTVNIGELNVKLLEKVEELTLYAISQQKEIDCIKKQLQKKETNSTAQIKPRQNNNTTNGFLIATCALFVFIIGRGQFSKLINK